MKPAKRLLPLAFLAAFLAVLGHSSEAAPSLRTPGEEKEWTVAVYLNADNDLDLFGPEDIAEMVQAGSNEHLNVVVLHDGHWEPAVMYFIEKGKAVKLRDMGEIDMGDPKTLVSFMDEVIRDYPARHFSLTIWNHGSGWRRSPKKPVRGISWDDTSGNHISTNALGGALSEIRNRLGHPIDVLDMDACLMQMLEVAWTCKDSCDFIVTSEETEPGKGAPYAEILSAVTPGMSPEEFARSWARLFVASYDHGSQGVETCTQSVVRCSAIPALNDAVNKLSKSLMSGAHNRTIVNLWDKTQHFALDSCLDLIDLADVLKNGISDPAVGEACDAVLAAAKEAVIENGRTGHTVPRAFGISIYFPERFYEFEEDKYRSLDFALTSDWDEFLVQFHKLRTASFIIEGLESGNLDPLREFARFAPNLPPDFVRGIADDVRFKLFSEGTLPRWIVDSAAPMIGKTSSL